MNIEQHRKNVIENLPDHFELTGKDTITMINQLFEMVKLNNNLINVMEKRIKLLEMASTSKQFMGSVKSLEKLYSGTRITRGCSRYPNLPWTDRRKDTMKKRIKHNDLLPWFIQDHEQLPAGYLKSCKRFFESLKPQA